MDRRGSLHRQAEDDGRKELSSNTANSCSNSKSKPVSCRRSTRCAPAPTWSANGTARASVASAISIGKQRAQWCARSRLNAHASSPEVLASTPNYETRNINRALWLCARRTWMATFVSLSGFVPVASTASARPSATSSLARWTTCATSRTDLPPWLNGGAANNATFLCGGASTGAIDVYPVLMFGEGRSVTPRCAIWALDLKHSPPKASDSDPAGQRGSLAATSYIAAASSTKAGLSAVNSRLPPINRRTKMARLNDISNAALRGAIGNYNMTKGVLAINAGSAATIR